MSKDTYLGYITGKRLSGHYPVCIDDFYGNQEEFIYGLRLAGYCGQVSFA